MSWKKAPVLLPALFLLLAQWATAEPLALEAVPKIQAVALHGNDHTRLFGATGEGLYVSKDGGLHWQLAYPFRLPATMVAEAPDGTLWAFVAGKGLLKMQGDALLWTPVSNGFGAQVLTSLSVSKKDPQEMAALTQFGKLFKSSDGGKHWHKLELEGKRLGEAARRGKALYAEKCQSCHGTEGVGESYSVQSFREKGYIMAPPLDDSAHAWHHTDEALVKTILEGTSRPSRMPAWRTQGMDEQQAGDLVAYIKSLWGKRALECQGPKHMQCMQPDSR